MTHVLLRHKGNPLEMKNIKLLLKQTSLVIFSLLFAMLMITPSALAAAGYTWTDQSSAGSRTWQSITSSSDGSHLAAVENGGDIFTSTDYGATWTDQTAAGSRFWGSIASSIDGSHIEGRFKSLPLSVWFASNADTAYNTVQANKLASDMATQTTINLLTTGKDEYQVA